MTASLSHLCELLDRHFNEEEVRSLCLELGVEYDNLGGRGKAANIRELVQKLHRQQRLPALVDVARQQRPLVAWPDSPPPVDSVQADALQDQAQRLFERVKSLLFPHVWSRDERKALLLEAFYPAHNWVLEQIQIDGKAADFLPHCWYTLHQGAGDGTLNGRLLNILKFRYGQDGQQQIDTLIEMWQ